MTAPPRLLIGTPTYTGQVHMELAVALVNAGAVLNRAGVPFALSVLGRHYLPDARNRFVAQALAGGFSHLLMCDADMSWPGDAPLRLLAHGVDAVGGVYRSRHGDWWEIAAPRPVPGRAGLVEVEMVGGGMLMLSRAWMERMSAACGGAPFRTERAANGAMVYEDFAALLHWTALGGKLHADPSFEVVHHGEVALGGTLAQHRAAGRPVRFLGDPEPPPTPADAA